MTNGNHSEKKKVRILAIDGGGIRGIIPASLLAELETRTGQPASSLFDLVAGTSTGGVLVLALARPKPGFSEPAHTAAEMVDFYKEQGPKIFTRSLQQRLKSADGLLSARYSDTAIEGVLQSFFGDTRLKDAIVPVFVPSYELVHRTPFFFRSTMARQRADYDFPMHSVARSASAAPTYFPPEALPMSEVQTETHAETGTGPKLTGPHLIPANAILPNYILIDGGVFANNPAACALVEAKVQFPGASDFTVLSLGTGALKVPALMNTACNWGLAQWARPILDTVFDGVSSTVDFQLSQLLVPREDGTQRYLRIQPSLTSSDQSMDNATPEALRLLDQISVSTIKRCSKELDDLCRQLCP